MIAVCLQGDKRTAVRFSSRLPSGSKSCPPPSGRQGPNPAPSLVGEDGRPVLLGSGTMAWCLRPGNGRVGDLETGPALAKYLVQAATEGIVRRRAKRRIASVTKHLLRRSKRAKSVGGFDREEGVGNPERARSFWQERYPALATLSFPQNKAKKYLDSLTKLCREPRHTVALPVRGGMVRSASPLRPHPPTSRRTAFWTRATSKAEATTVSVRGAQGLFRRTRSARLRSGSWTRTGRRRGLRSRFWGGVPRRVTESSPERRECRLPRLSRCAPAVCSAFWAWRSGVSPPLCGRGPLDGRRSACTSSVSSQTSGSTPARHETGRAFVERTLVVDVFCLEKGRVPSSPPTSVAPQRRARVRRLLGGSVSSDKCTAAARLASVAFETCGAPTHGGGETRTYPLLWTLAGTFVLVPVLRSERLPVTHALRADRARQRVVRANRRADVFEPFWSGSWRRLSPTLLVLSLAFAADRPVGPVRADLAFPLLRDARLRISRSSFAGRARREAFVVALAVSSAPGASFAMERSFDVFAVGFDGSSFAANERVFFSLVSRSVKRLPNERCRRRHDPCSLSPRRRSSPLSL